MTDVTAPNETTTAGTIPTVEPLGRIELLGEQGGGCCGGGSCGI